MTARRITLTAALLMIGAGSAQAQAQAPVELRYKPVAATLAYVMTDTTISTMVSPMGEIATNIFGTGSYELSSEAAGDSLRVKAKLTEMKASMAAMGQEMEAPLPEGWDAEETLTFNHAGIGPASGMAAGATGNGVSGTVQRLFLPLPAGAVAQGQSWTDSATVTMGDEMTGSVVALTTGTWVGDTAVDSRQLRVLRYTTDYTINAEGVTQGMQISQKMAGQTVTMAHFDPALGMMVRVDESGELTGTMNAPDAGMINAGMKLAMRRSTHVR